MDFIDNLSSKLDKDKISILIGHVPLDDISERQQVPLRKVSFLLEADASYTKCIVCHLYHSTDCLRSSQDLGIIISEH